MREFLYNHASRPQESGHAGAPPGPGHGRSMASRIEPRILEAAIALFADFGYFGVTTRDIARKARVTEGSIYRLFGSKDRLFESSLETAIGHLLDPAQFLLIIFENQQKQDFPSAVRAAVRLWYTSLAQQSARILIQALLSRNDKWRQAAHAPLEKIIGILAGTMDREVAQPAQSRLNANTVARSLILALFQLKITSLGPKNTKEENEQMEGMLQHWIHGLAAAL